MWDSIWIDVRFADISPARGAIGVQSGKIAWVGLQKDLPTPPEKMAKAVHKGEGKWVTPGLIDCHTHLVYGGNRAAEFEQRLNGATYEEIARAGGGIVSTVKATREAGEHDLFCAALDRLRGLMREGVTGVEIKSGYGLDTATEKKMLAVATRLGHETGIHVQRTFLGAHALPPEYKGRADDYIEHICNEMLPALHKDGLVDAVDAFCDAIGFTPPQTERVFKTAQALGLPVKLHAEQLSNQNGAALAARYKALSADHLEHLDEDGIRAMAEAGTVAVLLPGAYYFLREKTAPPVDLLRKHHVPIAIATDHNPGSSPVHSLLLMLNMACTLFRLTPTEALEGVTANAAKALGWTDCGRLEAGLRADFVLWNVNEAAELCYNVGLNPCHAVVRDGVYFSASAPSEETKTLSSTSRSCPA